MFKEYIWKTFESTGLIEVYMFYSEIKEKDQIKNVEFTAEEEIALSN